jgi:hypothetical protein
MRLTPGEVLHFRKNHKNEWITGSDGVSTGQAGKEFRNERGRENEEGLQEIRKTWITREGKIRDHKDEGAK